MRKLLFPGLLIALTSVFVFTYMAAAFGADSKFCRHKKDLCLQSKQ